ncbi:NAD(P)(+) transhydrogenase (Re/Si-specific) subunit beta, partial [Hyalangium sp.]|uniref:NAD(P)(+) transhydrogenase (Re/Si-specific) subunit beta n=1 Tax=Hyalangium sp. TaxID=2028555 RepID=UPI002D2274AA
MNGDSAIVYLLSGVLFIRSLGGLSKQETAARGNLYGMIGMALAVGVAGVTWFRSTDGALGTGMALLAGSVLVGSAIGAVLARRVEMTGMPELVAILHSFVGLAAVLVGISSYLAPGSGHELQGAAYIVARVEIWVGVAVGALTFTGSIVAWAKLRGTLSGKPLLLPGRHMINAAIAGGIVLLTVPFVASSGAGTGLVWLLMMTVLAGLLGIHLV